MKLHFESNQKMLEDIHKKYRQSSLKLIRKISEDKDLSEFDTFNKRLKLNIGMGITYNHELSGIKRIDTKKCYKLMLKITDLWFAFEHLCKVAKDTFPLSSNQKIAPYDDAFYKRIGMNKITKHFNELLYAEILHKKNWRKEFYLWSYYLQNNVHGGVKSTVGSLKKLVQEKESFQERHIFALAYALRNLYVHKGIAAALGSNDYKFKVKLYSLLYDTLVLYSFYLANEYCKEKIKQYK